MALLLAKRDDFTAWNGLEDFVQRYRSSVIRLAVQPGSGAIAPLIGQVEGGLLSVAEQNHESLRRLQMALTELEGATEPEQLRRLISSFHQLSRDHFAIFAAPQALFQMTSLFMKGFLTRCMQLVRQQLPEQLPPVSLFALGSFGRFEGSCFSRLQLAMVWEGKQPDELMEQLCRSLVTWLRVGGVAVEEEITPLRAEWRGNLSTWQKRVETAARSRDKRVLIDLLRINDRAVMVDDASVAVSLDTLCNRHLPQKKVVSNLVWRVNSLTNGIGMMGGLKLEKSGPHRGSFSLLEHALLPLGASVAALALIHAVEKQGTLQRLHELVKGGWLDVDLAERAMQGWYHFNRLRLELEQNAAAGSDFRDIIYLDTARLSSDSLQKLHDALETTGDLQRYLQIRFGSF